MLHNLKVRKPEFFVKINQELKISYLWNLKFHLQDFSMTVTTHSIVLENLPILSPARVNCSFWPSKRYKQ